ncbi:ATP-dependent 6-phosphofructokinase [Rhodocaloribacter litoris]|uniref:6-phosphofructokinase n=1 Tax=Rhodocaloribacter litoris TaxID=2558931 RepID=UPI00141DDD59|nr:ATP-dependent 6-phosphofructokinase [Rhodocaloribacter litoris]QXD14509.1 ATP-dependent 6-phosphofructokinase [Rhodocaloribacter litoris]
MSRSLRVGVLTGGGDCPGLNAVIRAVTKSLILEHNAEVLGFEDGFLGLIERRMRPLSYGDVSGILTRGGTILGTHNKANPFSYYKRGGADVSAQVLKYAETLGLDALVAIGGDGTMSIAHRLQQMGLNVVGVPKTIDNDLVGTDRTFGFDTAVSIVVEAIDRLHTTAQSHQRVMIVETMGRYAGWIALYAGVAGGADVILIPEFEYEIDEVVQIIRERESYGRSFTIIVIAEGAKPRGGELVVRDVIEESPDPLRLGGVGRQLELQLRERVKSEVRTTILGHVQRGGTPSAYDRNLATVFGTYAAAMVADGSFGRMAALQENRITSVPLELVAGKTRKVPRDAPMVAAALAVGTSFGVRELSHRFVGTEETAAIS